MAERRIKLSPQQRDELLIAWRELALAHKKARQRVAAALAAHAIQPETPGRLGIDPDGALVFVVPEAQSAAHAEGE